MQNGNNVSNTATQMIFALGTLGLANFDRAKAGADRIHASEVRIAAYLAIAQQAIGLEGGERREDRAFVYRNR